VPRIGFFEELCSLESKAFNTHFNMLIENLNHKIKQKHINKHLLLNCIKVLLRYGKAEYVVNFSPLKSYSFPLRIEIAFLKICAKIELDLANKNKPDLSELVSLINRILPSKNITQRFKLLALNKLIVNYFRYVCQNQSIIVIERYVQIAYKKLSDFHIKDSQDSLLIAYICRGLAMSSTLTEQEKRLLLEKSEKLSRSLFSDIIIENIVYKENLYTTLQTMAKYALYHNKADIAISRLHEMINLDPFDSTAYSELGLLLFEQENYAEAIQMFHQARTLGPPGVGMNFYYEAKCHEFLGNMIKYVSLLESTTRIDPFAISPWLDLLDYYKNTAQNDMILKISKLILNQEILMEQLTTEEQQELLNYANKSRY